MGMEPKRFDECGNDFVRSVVIIGIDGLIRLERSSARQVALGADMPGTAKGEH